MQDAISIPLLIRQAREKRRWTQKQLAEAIGVGETTVRAWENGRHFPSFPLQRRLEEVLEISFQDILLPDAQTPAPSIPSTHETKQQIISKQVPREKNRHRMLKRVQSRWIEGVLEKAPKRLIALALQEQPDAVENPWGQVVQESNRPLRLLSPSSSLTNVYDETDGTLLILGEPGAGKTTFLLNLTKNLLARARMDETSPIPVVFHLSSWAEKQLPLTDWMREELTTKYQVPRQQAYEWISTNQIHPLLDGLDEISPTYLTACVEAINRYRKENGMVSMVVCSRSATYFEQRGRLLLNTAVMIQPLTREQCDHYLSSEQLSGLRAALHDDPALQEVVRTPLMLNACAAIYQNKSREEILAIHDQEERRYLIIEQYVMHVWHRGQRPSQYHQAAERVISVLAWLARQMQRRNQTEWYLERLQPDWLASERMQKHYQKWAIRVIFCITLFVEATLLACFRGDTEPDVPGLFYWLGSREYGNSILGWMAPGVGGGMGGGGSLGLIIFVVQALIAFFIDPSGPMKFSLKPLLQSFIRALCTALIVGSGSIVLTVGILSLIGGGLTYGIDHGVGVGIYVGLLTWLMMWLIGMHQWRERQQKQKHTHRLHRSLGDRLIDTGLYFLSGFLGMFIWYAIQAGTIYGNPFFAALCVGLGTGLMFGLSNSTEKAAPTPLLTIRPAEIVGWSWSGMARDLTGSVRRGVVLGIAIALPTIVVLGIMSSLFHDLSYAWRYGLIYGLIVGSLNGVAAILIGLLNSGWSSEMIPNPRQYSKPNEGIRRSRKNAFFAAGLFGPIGGIISGICCGICFWLAGVPGWFFLMLGLGLVSGIGFALQFWSVYGGRAWIEHCVLRWFLWREGALPWRSIDYFDEAVRRTLLRKVGGGYIFSHKLFMEYFAHFKREEGS